MSRKKQQRENDGAGTNCGRECSQEMEEGSQRGATQICKEQCVMTGREGQVLEHST